jgi:hypothetical protein
VRGKIENLEPGYVRASVKVARYLFGPAYKLAMRERMTP